MRTFPTSAAPSTCSTATHPSPDAPADPGVAREREDAVLRTVARLDGKPFPTTRHLARGWLTGDGTRLTAEGLARSDLVGPWLVSAPVRLAMASYAPR